MSLKTMMTHSGTITSSRMSQNTDNLLLLMTVKAETTIKKPLLRMITTSNMKIKSKMIVPRMTVSPYLLTFQRMNGTGLMKCQSVLVKLRIKMTAAHVGLSLVQDCCQIASVSKPRDK